MEKDVKSLRNIDIKEEILNFIKLNGPSLPSEVAKRINKPTYITSAVLAEMADKNLLKTTNLKIGSSPIYFLESQFPLLEKFQEYLDEKEKEVLELLKKNKILDNEKINLSTRIILSKLRDFAIPLKIKINDKEKIIWKYFLVDNKEIEEILSKEIEEKKEEVKEIKEEVKEKETQKKLEVKIRKKVKKEKRKKSNEEFINYIEKNFENIEKISEEIYIGKKNIIESEMQFLLIIKNKKTISDIDILRALREIEERKMPIILLTKGKMTKKAQELINKSGCLIIVKNL